MSQPDQEIQEEKRPYLNVYTSKATAAFELESGTVRILFDESISGLEGLVGQKIVRVSPDECIALAQRLSEIGRGLELLGLIEDRSVKETDIVRHILEAMQAGK